MTCQTSPRRHCCQTVGWPRQDDPHRILLGAATVVAACAAALVLPAPQPCRAAAIDEIEAHEEYVYMISFSPDGRLAATAAGDNTAIVWDARKRTRLHVLDHEAAVYAAAISPDGKTVATGDGDGAVTLWKTSDGARIAQVTKHGDAVYCVAYSPDGSRLASAGGSTNGGDTTVRIWNADGLKLEAELVGHQRQVYGLVYSPDGQTVASGSSDKTIRLWSVASGKFTVLEGHTSDVYRCEFSPDGKQLVSTSQDGSVRLWPRTTDDAVPVHEGTKQNPVYAAAFSPGGRRLAAVSDDRRLRVWRTSDLRLEFEQKLSDHALYVVAFAPRQAELWVAGEDGRIYVVEQPPAGR